MEERLYPHPKPGMVYLLVLIVGALAAVALAILSIVALDGGAGAWAGFALALGIVLFIIDMVLFAGLKVVKPQEALVLTLFGNYKGTLREPGFYWVNPFCAANNPAAKTKLNQSSEMAVGADGVDTGKRVSLKVMTLSNPKQKINDSMGNPVEIGIAVTWRVVDTAKAVFEVDDYKQFLSLQCDSALRNIIRLYPYDIANVSGAVDSAGDDLSLRGSSDVIAQQLRDAIQAKVSEAGLEVIDARITHLAYAPEIAAVMLQRQQASAVVDARKLIVEGAVGMVESALEQLNRKQVVELDEERKAAMVSNLLVVLCAGREAQPVVNSGSLY